MFDFHELYDIKIKIKAKKGFEYLTARATDIEYMKVSIFELYYRRKLTLSQYSNFLRMTCMYLTTWSQNILFQRRPRSQLFEFQKCPLEYTYIYTLIFKDLHRFSCSFTKIADLQAHRTVHSECHAGISTIFEWVYEYKWHRCLPGLNGTEGARGGGGDGYLKGHNIWTLF